MSRWHSCNVYQSAPDGQHLWQFQVGGDTPKLVQQEAKLPAERLTDRLISKDWQTLYRKKLNVACLPADKVFLRVIELPASDFNEARSMVELQLEKLSTMPVQQIVWTFDLLPAGDSPLRTALVVIAARDYVEAFLGKLEGAGYLADRLEIPFLEELLATKITTNGAWIYPVLAPDQRACLVAWWYGGLLHNLTLLHLPSETEAGLYLRQQISQMAWAGELEGWLTTPPKWHLVAGPELAATWEPWLRGDGNPVELVAPLPPAEAALLTARRATGPATLANLVPPEFTARYRQTFIDRIWMRGLGAVVVVVLVGTMIYLALLQVLRYQVGNVEKMAAAQAMKYNETLKIKSEMQVLQDQVDLQFAALECWNAVAGLLPLELTLEGINFQKGKTLVVFGSGPAEGSSLAGDYNERLSKATYREQPLFNKVAAPDLRVTPGRGLSWTLNAEVKRNVTD